MPLVPVTAVHLPAAPAEQCRGRDCDRDAGRRERRRDARAVDGFTGLEHAMELVADVGGVRFVNDSKATNVEAALRVDRELRRGLVAIIGGRFKGGDFAAAARRRCSARAPGGRGDRRSERRWSRGAGGVRAGARSRRRSAEAVAHGVRAGRARRAWCCWRRRARASTCSATTRSAAGGSRRRCSGSCARRLSRARER